MDACERGIIVEVLRACRNDRTEAAHSLRISRVTLHDRLRSAAWRCPGEGSPAGEQQRLDFFRHRCRRRTRRALAPCTAARWRGAGLTRTD
jgi:hypothetical protein